MNQLRIDAGTQPDPTMDSMWRRLDAAIGRKTPAPHEVTRYRGMSGINILKGV